MKIGFIGLGNMGAPMAANLVKAGYAVNGFDVAPAALDGVDICADAASCATDCDVVITMLPNGAILQAVADEIKPVMQAGTVLLDCSTVDVETAKSIAAEMAEAGIDMLDAPVSGGITGAAAGTLTFMVGGTDKAFAIASPLFEVMGNKAVHVGGAGAGQAVKICNNMILG